MPNDESFDDQTPAGSLHPRLLLTNPQGGEYYLRLRWREDASGSVALTITVTSSEFEITRVYPLRGSNLGASSILRGAQFTPHTTVSLRGAGGVLRAAESIKFVSENRLVAKINLTWLATGQYEIEARDVVVSILALDAFEVTEQPPGETGAFNYVKTIAVIEIKGTISRSWRNQRIAFGEYNNSESPLATPLDLLPATNVQPEQEVQGARGSDTVPPRMLPRNYWATDV